MKPASGAAFRGRALPALALAALAQTGVAPLARAQAPVFANGFEPFCAMSAGGSATVAAPLLVATLFDGFHEAWFGSPAVADIDGDGVPEILAARNNGVTGWHADGQIVFGDRSRPAAPGHPPSWPTW
jgi:hypothetical protein